MELQQKVEAALDQVRPAMEADGGGVDLVSIENGRVLVQLKGMCVHCPSIELTMKFGIERTIREHLPEIREVVRVA